MTDPSARRMGKESPGRISGSPLRSLIIVAAAAALMASIIVSPKYKDKVVTKALVGEQLFADELVAANDPSALGQQEVSGGQGGVRRKIGTAGSTTSGAISCARGRNGGATDTGVTGGKISLAANHVKSGPGSSFLGTSWVGIQAVKQKVNAAGGICGRLLDLKLVDDGWDGPRGKSNIEDFIREGRFALPVVPSSEGLTLAIEAGTIKKGAIPVVGSDGMLIQQYSDPYVWPVATATNSQMRIMAKYAYTQKGARTFGIVYDKFYRFGREGAEAFKKYVETELAGATLKAYVGVEPLAPNYSTDAKKFNDACAGNCDMVAMLLEPGAAERWVAARPQFGTKVTSGAQPLFNQRFAANCGAACAGMLLWTGYNPPIGRFSGLPGMRQYEADVKSVVPTVDTSNAFLEGSYLGMTVFVEALKQVGPTLTREALRKTLDSYDFSGVAKDFTSKLSWTPQRRYANTGAQAFSIAVAQGGFAGFAEAGTGFLVDPEFGG